MNLNPFIKSKKQIAESDHLTHYEIEMNGEHSHVHLRTEPDGEGILIVNANRVMHLNPTALFMARLALESAPLQHAVREITRRFHVSTSQARHDYAQFANLISELIRPDGACPVHELQLELSAPFSSKPSAPYRMDLALTYRCNNDCSHCYNARPRSYPEQTTDQWKCTLDKLWDLGIPHIVFTGGEPTLRSDLTDLVAHARKNGQITGLNTNARRLQDPCYVDQLVNAGLDHVQITVESHDQAIHDYMVRSKGAWAQTIAGVKNALVSPLYVMTNTTMLRENSLYLEKTLEFLAALGVPTIGLNALIYAGKGRVVGTGLAEDELLPLLELAKRITQTNGQRLIWYTPTQYCHFDPMQLDLGVKGCTAALYNMCVEPDGGVLPCQSFYHQLGNILDDPWSGIWNHEICIGLRERRQIPSKCQACALLSECGGGCPLFFKEIPDASLPEAGLMRFQNEFTH